MRARSRILDFALVLVVIALYIIACFSVVMEGEWSTGPWEDVHEFDGWSCVFVGWLEEPIGWLANPFILLGAVLLVCGFRLGAITCGLVAALCVLEWSLERHVGLHRLRAGYYLWSGTVAILLVGSTLLWVRSICGATPSPCWRGAAEKKNCLKEP